MSGRFLRAGMYGLLVFCLLGAPLLPVSAAVAVDATSDQATAPVAGTWHPLSFVYSLVQSILGNDQGLENGAQKSSTGEPKDEHSADGDEPNIPPACYGPGIEPNEC